MVLSTSGPSRQEGLVGDGADVPWSCSTTFVSSWFYRLVGIKGLSAIKSRFVRGVRGLSYDCGVVEFLPLHSCEVLGNLWWDAVGVLGVCVVKLLLYKVLKLRAYYNFCPLFECQQKQFRHF